MSPRAWSCFAAVAVLWGIPYLFIKLAVDDGVPPVFLAWARIVLGATVLLALVGRGLTATLRGRLRPLVAYAVIEVVLPFPLIAAGELHVSSSLTAILIASAPLLNAGFAVRFDASERFTRARFAGIGLGLAGVVALVGLDVAGDGDELLGAVAILLAALGYAIAPLILRLNLRDVDARATMAGSLTLASVILLPAALLDPPDAVPTARALLAIAVLGVLCTAGALVFFGTLINEAGSSRALIVTYVNPVIAVLLGIVVLGEAIGPGAVAGLLLILGGSWLATGGAVTRSRAAPDR